MTWGMAGLIKGAGTTTFQLGLGGPLDLQGHGCVAGRGVNGCRAAGSQHGQTTCLHTADSRPKSSGVFPIPAPGFSVGHTNASSGLIALLTFLVLLSHTLF